MKRFTVCTFGGFINGQSLSNKYKQNYVYLIYCKYVAQFAWHFSKSLFLFKNDSVCQRVMHLRKQYISSF
jgi:hypothetical protein